MAEKQRTESGGQVDVSVPVRVYDVGPLGSGVDDWRLVALALSRARVAAGGYGRGLDCREPRRERARMRSRRTHPHVREVLARPSAHGPARPPNSWSANMMFSALLVPLAVQRVLQPPARRTSRRPGSARRV